MRKNLLLSFLFFSLVGVAFYMEEIQKVEKVANQIEKEQVLKISGQIDQIILPNITLLKVKADWRVTQVDFDASLKKVETFIEILRGLKSLELIDQNQEKEIFKKTNFDILLKSADKNIKIKIGDVSELTGNFYLKVNDKLLLVEDTSHYSDVYSSDLDLKLKKYLRLKRMGEATPSQYIESDLFKTIIKSSFKFAKIDSKRNRWYTLDFNKNEMSPPPLGGLKLKGLEKVFSHYLSQVRIKKLVQQKKNLLSDLASEINIGLEDSDFNVKLYHSNNGAYGKFVKFSDSDKIFEIEDAGSDVFFLPHQTYWLKTFQLPKEVFQNESFKFALSKDRKTFYSFKVLDVNDFKLEASDIKIASFDKNLVNFTFNLLLNLTIFTEASYVAPSESIKDFVESEFVLTLRLFNKNFHIRLVGKDILVLDEQLSVIYHFPGQNTQIKPLTYERIFTLHKN